MKQISLRINYICNVLPDAIEEAGIYKEELTNLYEKAQALENAIDFLNEELSK